MYKSFTSSIALISILISSSIAQAFDDNEPAGSAPVVARVSPLPVSEYSDLLTLGELPTSGPVVASAPIPSYPPITSIEAFTEFSRTLTKYIREKDFDSLERILVGFPSLQMDNPDIHILNSYSGTKAYALRVMYVYVANIQVEGQDRAVRFCTSLLNHIKEALQKDSNTPFDQLTLLTLAAKGFYKLSAYADLDIPNGKETLLRQALSYFEKALKKAKELSDIDRKVLESQDIETCIHSDASNCSNTLSWIVDPSQQRVFLDASDRYMKKLEGTKLYEDTQRIRKVTMLTLQNLRMERRIKTANPRAQAFYYQQMRSQFLEGERELKAIYSKDTAPRDEVSLYLKMVPQLRELHSQLVTVYTSKSEGWSLQVKKCIVDIENTIKEVTHETRRNNLEDIYKAYFTALGFGVRDYTIQLLAETAAFIDLGDLEEALKRIEIYKQFSGVTHDILNSYYKGLEAFIKNLQGDPKELQNWIKERQKKSEKRKQQKRKKQVALIKQDLDQKAAEQREHEERLALLDQQSKRTSPPAPQHVLEAQEIPSMLTSGLSRQEEKMAKAERHEEAKKQKAAVKPKEKTEQESPPQLETLSHVEALSRDFSQALAFPSIPDSLTEIEGLKSLERRVDNEITSGSWKCTREEIVNYFRSLGCTWETGKGSHEKIKLPQVLHRGTVINIFAELEDMLSLPKWTDTVPLYLRKQIVSMREKVIALNAQELSSVAG